MDATGRLAMVWMADSIRANAFIVRGAYLQARTSHCFQRTGDVKYDRRPDFFKVES
jgi:hypothetical protein